MLRILNKNVRHCKRVQLLHKQLQSLTSVELGSKAFQGRAKELFVYSRETFLLAIIQSLRLTLTAIALRRVFFHKFEKFIFSVAANIEY